MQRSCADGFSPISENAERMQWAIITLGINVHMYPLGYSDFHNLMGFTSKKMPNNILKNVCKKSFSIDWAVTCEFEFK